MTFTTQLPEDVGLYRHRWDFKGQMREQVLFVGYTNASAPNLQGARPNRYMPWELKCCAPHENLHADRLTPAEWGGWWERITADLPIPEPVEVQGRVEGNHTGDSNGT